MTTFKTVVRLGTRGSLLARTQSGLVAKALEQANAGLRVELVEIRTTGDRVTDKPLHDVGGKGLFTKELELALLAREIDFAVHSFKDVPVTMPLVDQADLIIAAVPPREDARDVLVTPDARSLADLTKGARVGTGSLRRAAQVLANRPDADVQGVRGNIDTRLRKLREGQFDAILLAMAGVRRAGLFDASMMRPLDTDIMLPAPGQGALALQCRRDDHAMRDLLDILNDPTTATCVAAEREIVLALHGDCHSPIAAHATINAETISLQAAIGHRDGKPPILRAQAQSGVANPQIAVESVLKSLSQQGAQEALGTSR